MKINQQARQDGQRFFEGDKSFLARVPEILSGLEAEGRLTLIDAAEVSLSGPGASLDWLGDAICFYFSRGHSEGQMHATFATAQGTIVFGGDFWPTDWHAMNPSRYMPAFDQRDTPALLANKRTFLEQVADRELFLHLYHDPKVVAVKIQRNSEGFLPIGAVDSGIQNFTLIPSA